MKGWQLVLVILALLFVVIFIAVGLIYSTSQKREENGIKDSIEHNNLKNGVGGEEENEEIKGEEDEEGLNNKGNVDGEEGDKEVKGIEDEEVNNDDESSNKKCIELGCDDETMYVGSRNSDKYYTCNCHYADRILPSNIVCFSSDVEAVNQGYIKIEDC